MHHPTDRVAYTTAFVTPVAEHWLANGKGEDGIINEYIKYTTDILLPFYLTLFNKMLNIGITPDIRLNDVNLQNIFVNLNLHANPILTYLFIYFVELNITRIICIVYIGLFIYHSYDPTSNKVVFYSKGH